jgi:hypothetical protein
MRFPREIVGFPTSRVAKPLRFRRAPSVRLASHPLEHIVMSNALFAPNEEKRLYYGIYRCSQGEDKQKWGIEAQKTEVKLNVERLGGELLKECLVERISGLSLEEEREKLISTLDYCRSMNFIPIVAKLDRIGRTEAFLHKIIAEYPNIYFCDIQSGDPLHISIAIAIAAQETRRSTDRSIRCMRESEKRNGIRNGTARIHMVSVSPKRFGMKLKPPHILQPDEIDIGQAIAAKLSHQRRVKRWEPYRNWFTKLHAKGLSYSQMAKAFNDGSYAVLLGLSEEPRRPLTTPAISLGKKKREALIAVGKSPDPKNGTPFTKLTVYRGLKYFGLIQSKKKVG